jgi:hypothetical protein
VTRRIRERGKNVRSPSDIDGVTDIDGAVRRSVGPSPVAGIRRNETGAITAAERGRRGERSGADGRRLLTEQRRRDDDDAEKK